VNSSAPLELVDLVIRTLALTGVGVAALVFATDWAVRRGHLKPFGAWPRMVRKGSDPLLVPLERRLLSSGKNPQDASLWLFIGVLIAGLLVIVFTRWLISTTGYLIALRSAGPLAWVRLVIAVISAVLMGSIVVRIIGKWFGADRWHRGMRPFYWLTDWIIEPVRRRMPPFGRLDLSPLVAYLLLLLARTVLLGLLS
jgi:YggT family protein